MSTGRNLSERHGSTDRPDASPDSRSRAANTARSESRTREDHEFDRDASSANDAGSLRAMLLRMLADMATSGLK